MGGEKTDCAKKVPPCQGSPPRGRGKGGVLGQLVNVGGITPAWAGKRRISFLAVYFVQDHPRVGGEKLKHPKYTTDEGGSPPRGRGKGRTVCRRLRSDGITPAWAGKSRACARGQTRAQDHPRVGGEKRTAASADVGGMGSPPRGRGKVFDKLANGAPAGITPAWAGKS